LESGERSRVVWLRVGGEEWEVYVDAMRPPQDLVIFGAGHDAIPMVRLARSLQMRVRVVDSRAQFGTRERFPEADEVIVAGGEEVGERVGIGTESYVVIMTHNFNYDLEYLRAVLRRRPRYLGLLGPKARTRRILEELEARGERIGREEAMRIHTPVGLDIGADSPEEIACSVLAEIVAFKNRRSGGPLVEKGEPLVRAA
jgi:xanthine/CO dehydrogenase XdhC/CoxF family maturation factor